MSLLQKNRVKWIREISAGITAFVEENGELDLKAAQKSFDTTGQEYYSDAVNALLSLQHQDEHFDKFLKKHFEDWVFFVRSTFGRKWGHIALMVYKVGLV